MYTHSVNQGKGAALKTGFLKATGDVVGIQDADMEYQNIQPFRLGWFFCCLASVCMGSMNTPFESAKFRKSSNS